MRNVTQAHIYYIYAWYTGILNNRHDLIVLFFLWTTDKQLVLILATSNTIFIHMLTPEGVPSAPGAFTSNLFWGISEKINVDNLDV